MHSLCGKGWLRNECSVVNTQLILDLCFASALRFFILFRSVQISLTINNVFVADVILSAAPLRHR